MKKDFSSMALVGPYTTDNTQRLNSQFTALEDNCILALTQKGANSPEYNLALARLILKKVKGGCSTESIKDAIKVSYSRASMIQINALPNEKVENIQIEVLAKATKGQSVDEYLENIATFRISKFSKLMTGDLDYTDDELLSALGF